MPCFLCLFVESRKLRCAVEFRITDLAACKRWSHSHIAKQRGNEGERILSEAEYISSTEGEA